MSRHKPLSQALVPGAELTEAVIDEMWSLRTRIFRLKESRPPEVDRASFGSRVRLGQKNLLLRDPDGVLRGMFSIHWRLSQDGRAMWVLPEYGFLDKDYRGHPALAWGVVRVLQQVIFVARGRPIWFAGIGYPRSFQSITRVMPDYYTLASDPLPEPARAVLLYLHETFASEAWDRLTHCVSMPTIPEPRPSGAVSPVWARYEALCPDWQQGYGLGLAARVDRGMLYRGLREIAVRTMRGRS